MICPKRIAVTLFHVFAQGSVLASALRTSAVCSLSFCFKQTAITHTTVILVGSLSAKTKLYSSARMRLWCYTLLGYLFWLVDCSPPSHRCGDMQLNAVCNAILNCPVFCCVLFLCSSFLLFVIVNSRINYLVDLRKKKDEFSTFCVLSYWNWLRLERELLHMNSSMGWWSAVPYN